MPLTNAQTLIMSLAVALGSLLTRALPFLLFPDNKKRPEIIVRLGHALPPAMMGLLVVYCLKDVSVLNAPYGCPELIAILITAGLQLWKRNVLLSIGAGTAAYMLLVQLVFV